MKKFLVSCAFLAAALFASAQSPQTITDVIADTVANYLSPLAGGGQPGEKILVLHFQSPTPALNDWAVDRFTEILDLFGNPVGCLTSHF